MYVIFQFRISAYWNFQQIVAIQNFRNGGLDNLARQVYYYAILECKTNNLNETFFLGTVTELKMNPFCLPNLQKIQYKSLKFNRIEDFSIKKYRKNRSRTYRKFMHISFFGCGVILTQWTNLEISFGNISKKIRTTPTPWLTQIRFARISLTWLFERFQFHT